MKMVKHFVHKTLVAGQDGKPVPFAVGRMAVGVDDAGSFVVRQMSGAIPRPYHVVLALQQFPELLQCANDAARARSNPYFVEVRQALYGAIDYILREYSDDVVVDYPVRSKLHVSSAGLLNEGIHIWVGDLGALLKLWLERKPASEIHEVVEEVPIFDNEKIKWEINPTILTISSTDGHEHLSISEE